MTRDQLAEMMRHISGRGPAKSRHSSLGRLSHAAERTPGKEENEEDVGKRGDAVTSNSALRRFRCDKYLHLHLQRKFEKLDLRLLLRKPFCNCYQYNLSNNDPQKAEAQVITALKIEKRLFCEGSEASSSVLISLPPGW